MRNKKVVRVDSDEMKQFERRHRDFFTPDSKLQSICLGAAMVTTGMFFGLHLVRNPLGFLFLGLTVFLLSATFAIQFYKNKDIRF